MKQPEIWKPIEELDGKYHISNYAKVKSFKYDKKNGKLIKPKKQNRGYTSYTLTHNNQKFGLLAHRLCAKYFLPNPNNLPEVHHISGDKSRNEITNLMWTEHIDNVRIDQADVIVCKHLDGRNFTAYGTRHAQQLTGICRGSIMKVIRKNDRLIKGWSFRIKK